MDQKIRYKMNNINTSKYIIPKYDIFIMNLSEYEDRSYAVLNQFVEKKIQITNLIVLDYCNGETAINTELTRRNCKIDNIKIISISKEDETDVLHVKETLDSLGQSVKTIGIDISCIPVPQIFLLIKILWDNRCAIYAYYTEPVGYLMNNGIFESYFSTKGPITTKEIAGFSGVTVNENQKTDRTLFCMLGFDNDLLPMVIQEAVPRKIIPINGFPSFFQKFKDISLSNNEKVLNGSIYAEQFDKTIQSTNYVYVEANNPFDVYNTLNQLKEKHQTNCIDVVPLGTKPMALGVCLYAMSNKDVRVLYPFPQEYVSSTTLESKNTWEYVIKE